MTKTITLTNAVIISITNYFASDDYWQNHNDSVSASISWIIRKNKKEISKALELIKEAETELNEEYNTDEKSQYAKDEDGNDTTDKVVKPEYWIWAEEWVCNFIADYGAKIFSIAYSVLGNDAWMFIPYELDKVIA